MYEYESRKLNFQLVPQSCWYTNLRSILPNWSEVSYLVRKQCKCDICGKKGQIEEFDAHEVWKYDDHNFIQSLDRIICVCKDCHACIHIGHTSIEGDYEKAVKHYMQVNQVSKKQYDLDEKQAFLVWNIRSTYEWILNRSALIKQVEQHYNISCDIENPINGRYYDTISYQEKDLAKKFGAKWDNNKKMWYFPTLEQRDYWRELENC